MRTRRRWRPGGGWCLSAEAWSHRRGWTDRCCWSTCRHRTVYQSTTHSSRSTLGRSQHSTEQRPTNLADLTFSKVIFLVLDSDSADCCAQLSTDQTTNIVKMQQDALKYLLQGRPHCRRASLKSKQQEVSEKKVRVRAPHFLLNREPNFVTMALDPRQGDILI